MEKQISFCWRLYDITIFIWELPCRFQKDVMQLFPIAPIFLVLHCVQFMVKSWTKYNKCIFEWKLLIGFQFAVNGSASCKTFMQLFLVKALNISYYWALRLVAKLKFRRLRYRYDVARTISCGDITKTYCLLHFNLTSSVKYQLMCVQCFWKKQLHICNSHNNLVLFPFLHMTNGL